MTTIKNFTTIDSEYGTFIVNRHCHYQAEVLIKTGRPHIQPELDKILAIANTLTTGSITLDVGANIGLVAVPLAQLLGQKRGVVHAFEPQRMMAYALSGAAALNDLDNLYVNNQAVGVTTGWLNAEQPDCATPQDFGLYSLVDHGSDIKPHADPNKFDGIQQVSIDSLQLPRLDLLKIDVEGMEVEVLQGAKSALKQYLPWCWVEYWQVGVEAIKRQFSGLGYQFYKMDELNLLCAPELRLETSSLNINAKAI